MPASAAPASRPKPTSGGTKSYVCGEVVDALSGFERKLLQRATNEYNDFWRDDEPEPSTGDARRWLAQEMFQQLADEAIDHGQDLIDVESDEQANEEPEE